MSTTISLPARFLDVFFKGVLRTMREKIIDALLVLGAVIFEFVRFGSFSVLREHLWEAFMPWVWVLSIVVAWHSIRSAIELTKNIQAEVAQYSEFEEGLIVLPSGERAFRPTLLHLLPRLFRVKIWATSIAIILVAALCSVMVWLQARKAPRPPELSAQQAQIVVVGVKPVPVSTDGTWAHVNVFYHNDGILPAHAVSGHIAVTVKPHQVRSKELIETQDNLLSWSDWKSLLHSRKDEELAHGVAAQWFSFPDHPSEESQFLAATLPRVIDPDLKWYAYVMVVFKYWDSSMDEDVLGVSESCVFFVNDLDINRTCGRTRTFLERQKFTHASIVTPSTND
jgi:hypothetical protein